jgi:galactokinase
MVEVAWALPGCYGARLTGAGFGGCTVNLVAEEAAKEFSTKLAEGYYQRTGIKPDIYICHAEDGAGVLE